MRSQSYPVRPLSAHEKTVVPASISAGLDLDAIEIHKRPWNAFTPKFVSVVRGNTIYYPNDPGPSEHPLHLAHLVHEVVHVWQYLVRRVGLYHPQWVYDRRYRYHLSPDDRFLAFGWEQQAAIVEDSFRVSRGLAHRWAQNNPSADLLAHTVAHCHRELGSSVI